ncbi:MAG: MarR family transcriptional regulator, partial [Corynebacterium sp.]|nr:MarR family transcriptional regulator [Corynebacterium sp.]
EREVVIRFLEDMANELSLSNASWAEGDAGSRAATPETADDAKSS